MNLATNLENSRVVGATEIYDAMNEAPTPEEEAAMDELAKRRKAAEYEAEFARLSKETPRGLNLQLREVFGAIEKIEPGFDLFMLDAFNHCDALLIGKLMLRARDLYLHSLVAEDIGV